MRQPTSIAEHIAEFTGRKVRFREKKFIKSLRRQRRKRASEPSIKQTGALETPS